MTNITTTTDASSTFFQTGGAYHFNDTATDQYLAVTSDSFFVPQGALADITVTGSIYDLGDHLQFVTGTKVDIDWEDFHIIGNTDFNIELNVNLNGNQTGERTILTNTTSGNPGNNEFALVQFQTFIGGTTWSLPRFRLHIEGKTFDSDPTLNQLIESGTLSFGTWYKVNIRRVNNVITLLVDDVAVSTTITNDTNFGSASETNWHFGSTYGNEFAGLLKNFNYQFEGDNKFTAPFDDVSIPYTVYDNNDFLIEQFTKFNDASSDQYLVSNMIDPSVTIATNDFRVTYLDASNTIKLEVDSVSSEASVSTAYGVWNHIAIQKKQTTWKVWVNGQQVLTLTNTNDIGSAVKKTIYFGNATSSTNRLEAYIDAIRFASFARFTSDNFIPLYAGRNNSPVGAYLDGAGDLVRYISRHWPYLSLTNTISETDLTSIGGGAKYGTQYTFDRAHFGDCIGAFGLVYGGSESRAYFIYNKAIYTDGTENFVERVSEGSTGLFYRKVTIGDDLTITLGSEVEVGAQLGSPEYGWTFAADGVKLGANVFINIIMSARDTANYNAYSYGLKFAYS